jgi:hypothetical protein
MSAGREVVGDEGTDWFLIALGTILAADVLVSHTGGVQGLSLFQDDFFYYSKIAANIAAGHGSTFGGVVPTNGYHPLWMLCITLISWFTKNIATVIFVVECLISLSSLASFVLARRILQQLAVPWFASSIGGLGIAAIVLQQVSSGMEIILTVPLGLLLCSFVLREAQGWEAGKAFLLGLLCAVLVLSRLDSIMLVALLGIALLFDRQFRHKLSGISVLAFCCGFAPFVLYLVTNLYFFHVMLPISGEAKQLRISHGFATTAFRPIPGYKWGVACLIVDLIGLVLLAVQWKAWEPRVRRIALAVLIFPFVHMLTVSQLSDWPFWSWYFYSSVIALPFAAVLGSRVLEGQSGYAGFFRIAGSVAAALFLLDCGKVVVKRAISRTPPIATRVAAAEYLRDFAKTHPGIYAMGDRSGVVGQELGNEMVQTEGLVMDKNFLNHLRREDDLLSVLRDYGVRYYVASIHPGSIPACLEAVEPAQAGPSAPHMKSQLCASPVGIYRTNDYTTLVFDLAPTH